LSRTSVTVVVGIILLIAWAGAHIVGLVIAGVGLFGLHVISVRLNPRVRHRPCGGSGRRPGRLISWAHHRDVDCLGSGRVLRPNARVFGMPAIRAEAAAQRQARTSARANRAWR
jgi:hypothetical protein